MHSDDKAGWQTLLSALVLTVLAEEADFPKGVFNVVLIDKNTAQVGLIFCESPKIEKKAFLQDLQEWVSC